ncbi:MAG: 16S rRNA (cytidine1402-2'-O)-methyltransferase [Polaribacter sp.]|jgi:16S rRNA (cytidine1402-2'-O)-methyltransferase
MLYLVPTPIGNLEDMTFRALKILKDVDVVLAEDTRTSKKLFQHYEIETPLRSYHAHNEHGVTPNLVAQMQSGTKMALITDAGSPGISDPGFLLVRACVESDVEIVALPGATAFVPAITASGIPCNRFYFEGFLPQKKGRETRLKFLAKMTETFALYESPYRLVKCLKQLSEHCGEERTAAVCREITKLYEEVKRGSLAELIAHYEGVDKVKGEIVIVVAGNDKVEERPSKMKEWKKKNRD